MNEASDQQDRADMEALAAGRDAALNDLISRHGSKLLGFLMRLLQNEEDAADLAQEVFVRVYQNRSKFDPKQKFTTWLYAIATNLAKDRFRYRARHPQVSMDAESAETGGSIRETLADEREGPNEEIESEERANAVRKAIASLPEELKAALILAEYEELSQAAIGEILHCSTKAVETRIYRAKQQLRKRLTPFLEPTP